MRRAYAVTSMVLGAALALGPASAAAATSAPDPAGVVAPPVVGSTVGLVWPVVAPVLGVVGDKPPKDGHPGKNPKPKPTPHKHQPPPPAPPPHPSPVPPPPTPVTPQPVADPGPPAVGAPPASTVAGPPANASASSRSPVAAAVALTHPTRTARSDPARDGAVAIPVARVPIAGLADPPPAFDPTDIPAWGYAAALVLLVVAGFAAWALHLRGARW